MAYKVASKNINGI